VAAVLLETPPAPPLARGRVARRLPASSWLVCSGALLLLVVGLRLFISKQAFPGDSWAAQIGASHKAWLVYKLTRLYQQVGRPLVAIGEVLAMLAWLWRADGRRAAKGLLLALLASLTCGVIKIVCGPTPLWLSLHHVGTDFPSGVVTFVTASGGYLAMVARRQGRRLMPTVICLVIAGAGPARILGGQHVLSDVLAGYMLGAAWLIVAYRYLIRPSFQLNEDHAWNIGALEAA